MQQSQNNYSMQTVHRAAQLLKSFSMAHTRLSMTDFHRMTGLSKSSLQRLLATLVREGFLVKDEETKTYALGIELYFLGNLVEKNSSLMSRAYPVMEDIHRKTGESVTLNMIHQNERKCIGHIQSPHELTALTYVGHTSPLYAGASAKVLLAHFTENELETTLARMELAPHTANTIVGKEKLKKELEQIREQGYAASDGERVKGAFSISAPIFDRFSQILAGLSLVIPTVRVEEFNVDTLVELVVNGAKTMTTTLRGKEGGK